MELFASVEDLQARWRDLNEGEAKRAVVLLGDATAMLSGELAKAGVEVDGADEVQATNLTSVCCAMVKRAMDSTEDGAYTQTSMTAGPYTQSWTPANPNGDMYITSTEKKTLGLKRQRIGMIHPLIGGGSDD